MNCYIYIYINYVNVSLQRFKKTFVQTPAVEFMLSKCTMKIVQKGSEYLP